MPPKRDEAKKRYASQGDGFSRAFRDRLGKWAARHNARQPDDPKIPVEDGPELMHFIGTLLTYDTLAESSLGETQVGKNWKLWKETYPEAAEVMLRFVQQLRTDDGRSFTLNGYEQKRTGRLHLTVSKNDGTANKDDGNDADTEAPAAKRKKSKKATTVKPGDAQVADPENAQPQEEPAPAAKRKKSKKATTVKLGDAQVADPENTQPQEEPASLISAEPASTTGKRKAAPKTKAQAKKPRISSAVLPKETKNAANLTQSNPKSVGRQEKPSQQGSKGPRDSESEASEMTEEHSDVSETDGSEDDSSDTEEEWYAEPETPNLKPRAPEPDKECISHMKLDAEEDPEDKDWSPDTIDPIFKEHNTMSDMEHEDGATVWDSEGELSTNSDEEDALLDAITERIQISPHVKEQALIITKYLGFPARRGRNFGDHETFYGRIQDSSFQLKLDEWGKRYFGHQLWYCEVPKAGEKGTFILAESEYDERDWPPLIKKMDEFPVNLLPLAFDDNTIIYTQKQPKMDEGSKDWKQSQVKV
ncbi:hypothetical protein C8A01DRAFT_41865 [Parachaetomium inaequale]|uniref:Uncharacterized protein n=1 Tax=Parachaetomium inaequale TaxID=2588326 RepID=A0AAN6P6G7_9PEZI|nr:hypothetical protein C8A01DRAFT_41865 [Parachaetomium inaequale]